MGTRRACRGWTRRKFCGTVAAGSLPESRGHSTPSPRSGPIVRLVALWAAIAIAAIGVPLTAVAQQLSAPEQRIIQLINQARVAQGLGPLSLTPELNAAAKAHAEDMAAKGYMEHTAPSGSTPQTRAIKAGYGAPANSAWLVLEVISARATPEAAANWLLSDRLHRGVLMRGYWREMGAAYIQGGPYGQFWVVEFGCRPNVLPVIAEPTASGGVTVRLSNEECTPFGTSEAIGKATEVMISDKPDFSGATWEPFVTTKNVASSRQRLRALPGREGQGDHGFDGRPGRQRGDRDCRLGVHQHAQLGDAAVLDREARRGRRAARSEVGSRACSRRSRPSSSKRSRNRPALGAEARTARTVHGVLCARKWPSMRRAIPVLWRYEAEGATLGAAALRGVRSPDGVRSVRVSAPRS